MRTHLISPRDPQIPTLNSQSHPLNLLHSARRILFRSERYVSYAFRDAGALFCDYECGPHGREIGEYCLEVGRGCRVGEVGNEER